MCDSMFFVSSHSNLGWSDESISKCPQKKFSGTERDDAHKSPSSNSRRQQSIDDDGDGSCGSIHFSDLEIDGDELNREASSKSSHLKATAKVEPGQLLRATSYPLTSEDGKTPYRFHQRSLTLLSGRIQQAKAALNKTAQNRREGFWKQRNEPVLCPLPSSALVDTTVSSTDQEDLIDKVDCPLQEGSLSNDEDSLGESEDKKRLKRLSGQLRMALRITGNLSNVSPTDDSISAAPRKSQNRRCRLESLSEDEDEHFSDIQEHSRRRASKRYLLSPKDHHGSSSGDFRRDRMKAAKDQKSKASLRQNRCANLGSLTKSFRMLNGSLAGFALEEESDDELTEEETRARARKQAEVEAINELQKFKAAVRKTGFVTSVGARLVLDKKASHLAAKVT